LEKQDAAIELIRTKTLRQNRMSGFFAFLIGGVVALFGVAYLFKRGWRDLALFLIAAGAVFFVTGYWFYKISKDA
jgi:membrane associated rhomboid family serine protease